MLVELISSMPAADMNRDKDKIIGKSFATYNNVKRKIVSVAKLTFQCMQWDNL
jgi:hypothetical protein